MTVKEILARHPWMEEPLRAYYRALPELLADRSAGKFVVVKGDELFDTWDTFRDAAQFAFRAFEPDTFVIQDVDARMLDFLAPAFGPLPAEVATCPS
jgi:hypothetical protein